MKSLRWKLLSAFGAVLVLLLAMSIVSIVRIQQFNKTVNVAMSEEIHILTAYETLRFNLAERIAVTRGYLLTGDPTLKEKFDKYTLESQEIEKLLQDNPKAADAAALFADSFAWGEMTETRVYEPYARGDKAAALEANNGEVRAAVEKLMAGFGAVVTEKERQMEQMGREIRQGGNALLTIVVTVSAFAIAVGILVAIGMARTITVPIQQVALRSRMIAAGDLTGEPLKTKSKDEIGDLVAATNAMSDNLKHIIRQLVETSTSVAASSQEISATTEEIAHGSSGQARSAGVINELVRELALANSAVARSAEATAELANDTKSMAISGGKALQQSVDAMNDLSVHMNGLQEDSEKIGEIIAVIDEIASQTNLLALNAAIEAARAGEQGRGFAVVAAEVRKLAERSVEATKMIGTIIRGMQNSTLQSVGAVDKVTAVSDGMSDTFKQMIDKINETAVQITEIAASCEEQSAQSENILTSVNGIVIASEEATAATEEAAASTQTLASLAESLNQSVARFKL